MWERWGVEEWGKSRRKKGGGKGAGDRGVVGVGEGRKSQRKRRERAQGIVVKIAEKRGGKVRRDKGAAGCGGREKSPKSGKWAGWEMLAVEDNPEKDGKY